jgi:hypothetical protein
MCSACGLLRSGVEWSEGVTGDENVPDRRLAERRRRITLINMLLEGSGVKLTEHGRQLIVRGPTGATRLVTELAHVWRAADELGRQKADPLNLGAFARQAGQPNE